MSIRRVGYSLLLGALLGFALPAAADSQARIVRLSYVDGDVRIDRGAGRGFERAVMNMPVVQSAHLETRDNATAEVEFEDGSTLRLIPNSAVSFQQLGRLDSGERVSIIEFLDGTVYLEATKKKDDFALSSGQQHIVLTHPARLRVSRHGSEIRLAVFKGDADVQTDSGEVRVKKDQTYALDLNDPSHYYLAKGVDADSYDSWDQQRDKYRETYAANHQNGYNSLYSYGWNDLNYFGSFFDYAGYGMLWRPFGVDPFWDPFADGAWMFYPSYGYMWVSGYPWGWMPYRYGSWLFVPTYGWCWQPGVYGNSWYAVTPFYGAPAGFVAPHPPVLTASATPPATVLVGRGPLKGLQDTNFRTWMEARAKAPGASLASRAMVTPVSVQPVGAAAHTSTMTSFRNMTAATAGGAAFRSRTFTPRMEMSGEIGNPSSGNSGWARSSGMSSGAARSASGGGRGMSGGGGGGGSHGGGGSGSHK